MKNLKILTLLLFALFIGSFSYGQQRALTNIQKNINKEAAGLEQMLNFTLDTLTLKSDKNILRVTFLSHDEKDSVIIDVDAPEVRIPLYHLKKGRYTIAVYREDKIIALGVKRVEDIPAPKDAIADLEESILRSSLSEEDQIARNIKPLKKKPKATKEKETRVVEARPSKKDKNSRTIASNSKKKNKESKVVIAKPNKSDLEESVASVNTKDKKAKNTAAVNSRAKKKKDTPKKVVKTRKQSQPRVVSNTNKKSPFEIAAEREEAKKAQRLKEEKDRAVASVERKRSERPTTLIEVKKVTYNLSDVDGKNVEKQSRADYRANNLRPNGTRYEN